MDDSLPPTRISEQEAASLLDRAAKIDAARGKEVNVSELRASALEAGISPEAFDRALQELRRRGSTDASALISQRESASGDVLEWSDVETFLHRPLLPVIGAALGGLALLLWHGLDMGDAGVVLPLIIAGAVALGLAMKRARDRSVLTYIADLALLWVGLTFVLMLGDVDDADEVLAVMSMIGGVAAVVGSTLVALPRKLEQPKLPSAPRAEL